MFSCDAVEGLGLGEVMYLAGLVLLDQDPIDAQGTGAGGKTEHEGMCWCGSEMSDPLDDVVGYVCARSLRVVPDDEPHCELRRKGAGDRVWVTIKIHEEI